MNNSILLFLSIVFLFFNCKNQAPTTSKPVKIEKEVALDEEVELTSTEKKAVEKPENIINQYVFLHSDAKQTYQKKEDEILINTKINSAQFPFDRQVYSPNRLHNELGKMIFFAFKMTLEQTKLASSCLPLFDQIAGYHIRFKEQNKPAYNIRINKSVGKILNSEDVLEAIETGSKEVTVKAQITLENIQEYDLITSTQTQKDVYFAQKSPNKVIEFDFVWLDKDFSVIQHQPQSLTEKNGKKLFTSKGVMDLFPCRFNSPFDKPILSLDDKQIPKQLIDQQNLYQIDMDAFIKKLRGQ